MLAAAMAAVALLQTTASAGVRDALDKGWRGAYDILVTADDEASMRGTDGQLLAPYAIATATERLNLDDLEVVRAVPGVEIAAPIGDVLIRPAGEGPRILYAVPLLVDQLSPDPVALRVSLDLSADEVGGTRRLAGATFDVIVDASNGASAVVLDPSAFPVDVDCIDTGEEGGNPGVGGCWAQRVPVSYRREGTEDQLTKTSGYIVRDALLFELPSLVELAPHLLFVDPHAEMRLLGTGADFLEPLVGIGGQYSIADLRQDRDAGHFDEASGVSSWIRSVEPAVAQWEASDEDGVIPIVDAAAGSRGAVLSVFVERGFGAVTYAPQGTEPGGLVEWSLPADLTRGETGKVTATETFDVTALLRASSPKSAVFGLPGEGIGVDTLVPPTVINRVREWAFSSQRLPVVKDGSASLLIDEYLVPLPTDGNAGALNPWLSLEHSGVKIGAESVAHRITARGVVGSGGGPLIVTVGSATRIDPAQSPRGTVPTVTTDELSTRWIGDARADAESEEIPPSLSGLGLSAGRPAAYASIASAAGIGIDHPISSIRVRVAGIDGGYTVDSLVKVDTVAIALRKLGYSATIVAGSSEAPFRFLVHGYAFPVVGDERVQRIGRLGVVEQDWPELGAAARVDRAVVGGNYEIAIWVVLATTMLFAIICAMEVQPRSRAAKVLHNMGWSRSDLRHAFLREDRSALCVVAIGGAGSAVWVLLTAAYRAGDSILVSMALFTVAASAAIVQVFAVMSQTLAPTLPRGVRLSQARDGRRRRSRLLGGTAVVGLRFAASNVSLTLLTGLCTTMAAVAAGAVALSVSQTARRAGLSTLADAAVATNTVSQVILAALGVLAAVVLTRVCVGMQREHLLTRARLLADCGWSAKARQLARGLEVGCAVAPGVIAGLAVTAVMAHLASQPLYPVLVATSVGALLVASLLVFSGRRVS